MSSALAVVDGQTEWNPAQLAALHQLGVEKATTGDLALFLSYAQRTGLDPFSKQIYMIPHGDGGRTKWTIITGIDGFRIIAERSGMYVGQTPPEWFDGTQWLPVWLKDTPPLAARVGVYRVGFDHPVYGVVMWREYGSNRGNWRTMPSHMLAKVAESHALRKAFPNDLSGIYTAEEMAQASKPTATYEVPPLTLDEIAASVFMAQTEAELRTCWQEARRANVLSHDVDSPWTVGQVMTVTELITEARQRVLNPVDVFADDVADADLVEVTLL